MAYLIGLSGLAYLVQAWVVGSEGFRETHTILILVALGSQHCLDDLAGRRRLAHAGSGDPSSGR
jgi:hypothetical protein